jgi:hypothetical protein
VTEGLEPDLPVIRRGVVLDPFSGPAVVGAVALKLERNFIGVELYDLYAEIAEEQCREAHRIYEAKNPITPSAVTSLPPRTRGTPSVVTIYPRSAFSIPTAEPTSFLCR